jgi:excisionase family DNA binding protein
MIRLTQQEAAAVLRKSVQTVYRLRREGELQFLPGRPVTIAAADLQAYIDRRQICRDQTAAPSSKGTIAASMKSAGAKKEDLAAARQARRIFNSLKKSSRTSFCMAG